MKHKIIRADGTTILQPIKSFHYTAQCNFGEDLRYGTVIPSSIEVEVFYNGSNMVSVGEELTYYQVFDVDSAFNPSTETTDKIGLFTVYECNKIGKDVYRFVAYDNLRKLDADFSERLRELNESNSFPMSAGLLLSEAASVAGVIYNFPPITMNWQLITLNSFYSDSITCKDIFSAAAELQATYWFCNSEGVLYIDDYAVKQKSPFWSDERYIICPTDQQQYYDEDEMELVPVFYKQDGLTQSDYYIHQVDSVKIIRSDGVMLGAAAQFTQDNTYYISGNVFADMAEISDWASYGSQKMSQLFVNIARFVYNQIQTDTSYSYRKTDVRLFPFRFPFSIGSMVWIENTDGLRYRMPVMHIDITDSAVILNAFGNEYYTDITGAYNTADQKATSLDVRLNALSNIVITTDELPLSIANGGSGMSAVASDTTISNIVVAGTGMTINTAYYRRWGMIAMVRIQMTAGYNHTSGTVTLGTLVQYKRPSVQAAANISNLGNGYINPNGEILFGGTFSSGNIITVVSTFILA